MRVDGFKQLPGLTEYMSHRGSCRRWKLYADWYVMKTRRHLLPLAVREAGSCRAAVLTAPKWPLHCARRRARFDSIFPLLSLVLAAAITGGERLRPAPPNSWGYL